LAGKRSPAVESGLDRALEDAVAGTDPVEVVSLSDALADAGTWGRDRCSQQALVAFAELDSMIAALRGEAVESVVDLVSRAMSSLGVDVEARVADPTGHSQAALVDFLTLAADIVGGDTRIGLGGFLARLREAERFDVTISHTRPTIPGAVQLMTVFAAKGLEFATVFVPFVSDGAFPGGRARGRWTTGASTVPWPLRPDAGPTLRQFPDASADSISKQHERYLRAMGDLTDRDHERLAYVALTRAEATLTVTGHWWGPGQVKPRGPHRFLSQIKQAVESADPDACRVVVWAQAPADGQDNPVRSAAPVSWPIPVAAGYEERVRQAVQAVQAARRSSMQAHQVQMPIEGVEDDPWQGRVRRWHDAYAALIQDFDQQPSEHLVRLGDHVGATTYLRALKEPEAVAQDLLRPMPRQPSLAAARGVAWHAWVETQFGQQSLWGMDELPGAADADIEAMTGIGGAGGDRELEELKAAFQRSRYATREPVAIERPFSVVIGGRVINGRIDAVFAEGNRFEVVDWKTGGTASIDPRQLAIYRIAWSQIHGVDWRNVDAAFVMVATGEEIRPDTDDDVRELLQRADR
jgi:DNA helicase-2/ATP-dependent DNA helicase PcrA